MENNQFSNKIALKLRVSRQVEQSLMWFIAISIYLLCFVLFVGKAPIVNFAFQAKNWLGPNFFSYVGVGLAAQLVDGTLGMAYGITSTSFDVYC
jgi:hypothetical protein